MMADFMVAPLFCELGILPSNALFADYITEFRCAIFDGYQYTALICDGIGVGVWLLRFPLAGAEFPAPSFVSRDLCQCGDSRRAQCHRMWIDISEAPFGRDVELAVIDEDGAHALIFACRRIVGGWMNAESKERLDVRPTHWREWNAEQGAQARRADGS